MSFRYRDSALSTDERVRDLLPRMTLEEKVGQMIQLAALEGDHENFLQRYHIGSYLHAVGDDVTRLQALNEKRSRLNIPLIFGIDAIHGHCLEDDTTVFPVQLALACTWNKDLLTEVGKITANEARASNLHWTFSPVLCIGRDPRWGRTSETFGEDPTLIALLADALATGYQTAEYPLAACAKHYAAYGETSGGRDSSDAHISEREMRNVFLPPFERVAKNGCKTFMAGYQSLNGIPCSANTWLMNTVLREEWQYEGVVVTDWNNCGQMLTLQKAARSMEEAVALCLDASNDIFMSTPEVYDITLALVREGRVSEARIDESVERILRLKFDLGLFDQAKNPNRQQLLSDTARWETSLEAAQQSLTLVKNSGVLPLSQTPRKIMLVGDNADNVLNQLGDWSFIPGMAAYTDTKTHRADTVTLKAALEAASAEHECEIQFFGDDYCGPFCENPVAQSFIQQAASADLIIFCAGDALKQYGEFHDRADLELPGNQNTIFDALYQTKTPIVSVMVMSKPHCINAVVEKSSAVIIAFNPGAKGGTALTQCLFGELNPSGRLPISFPRHVGQLPVYYNQAPGWHAAISPHYDGISRYIDLPESPLLAFGEGLNYSVIQYGEASLSCAHVTAKAPATLTLELRNSSERDAVEIVQLYCSLCIPGVTSPIKKLLSFKRVSIAAGTTRIVTFSIAQDDFIVWDKDMKQTVCSGEAELKVGKSSKDCDLQSLLLCVAC
ncbi:beta-glucosidase family protein [Teredinibacter purpureus]|uniref:beta-glucosidase family protein n=1 Tax=Teredinibacter purpureus TaxID=2731756 RepID=UPI0005F80350|nr:glycoside hydrolase family 3 N-terminal domain-containing protein [Teredinibacter purpureus]